MFLHLLTYSYLVEQQVQGAIAHILRHYAEELRLIADAKDLDDVVKSGFVEHLCLFQKAVPLSATKPPIQSQSLSPDSENDTGKVIIRVVGVNTATGSMQKTWTEMKKLSSRLQDVDLEN